MSIYALIKDEVVINTILWDGPDVSPVDFGEGVSYVEIGEGSLVSIGWSYKDGVFSEPPKPEPSHEELVYAANQEKNQRLSSADSIFLEWQTKLLLNIASDEEKQAVTDWVSYKEAVRSVDTNEAPNITWPEQPPIPESAQ